MNPACGQTPVTSLTNAIRELSRGQTRPAPYHGAVHKVCGREGTDGPTVERRRANLRVSTAVEGRADYEEHAVRISILAGSLLRGRIR